ncbi:alkaline phosphatase D family protein [Actinokineospora sp. NBRC 105648]|uniref:alkaline phosphatase D family protein n=1 Tax=Actinokineospora sp. NBRC 105648 TaxID=3032206 RepID=UPI0024A0E968|nr:alkaline phosphatase D family protein [Actinokineospora sp. NBRC 105648]GLZ39416.1 phosphodiesterase/alkaline phosphatase D [Actinokineospora sp. NBRC 105648]
MTPTTPFDRRVFLKSSAVAGGALLVPAALAGTANAAAVPQFAHGVASGDPLPDGVLLWTRVTPTPESAPGSGVGPAVEVRWEVATDSAFASVVRSGAVQTGPDRDHTVKVAVAGLSPATTYFYRFTLDGVRSSTGRTRTAPSVNADVSKLRLGLVSCSNWQAGYFSAYRHLAARTDLDGVLHVGDYLYEYQVGGFGARGVTIRPHQPATEVLTLADYRRRHAQYKTDPDLTALHAAQPWFITWDDHEYANDTWSGGADNHQPNEGDWNARKAAARQAYFEWMPVRQGPGGEIYRRFRWGRLAELSLLDLRSYRSKQTTPSSGDPADPSRTITGDAQMDWLKGGLAGTDAKWKLVGNSVMITPISLGNVESRFLESLGSLLGLPIGSVAANADAWDGYTADRQELLGHLKDNRVKNTVFLTGDIHSSWGADIPLDRSSYWWNGNSVATEFVTTSVTSDNIDDLLKVDPRTLSVAAETALYAGNWHLKYIELDSHGYSVVDVNPQRVQTDWYYVADRLSPTSGVKYAKSLATADGTQKVKSATGPVA